MITSSLIFSLILFIFIIIENIFYLSTINRRTYLILYTTIVLTIIIFLIIQWSINYYNIFKINSDEKISKEIWNQSEKIKDKLLNAIQLKKEYPKSELANHAFNTINNDIIKINLKYNLNLFSTKNILILTFSILIIASSFYTYRLDKASSRIMKYNTEFKPHTPFNLTSSHKDITLLSGDTLTINIFATGEIPDSLDFKWIENNKLYTLKIAGENGNYKHTFNNIKNNLNFWANYESPYFISSWDTIGTKPIKITTKKRPSIIKNNFVITPPKYTNSDKIFYNETSKTQFEIINNSKINFSLETNENISSAWMLLNDKRIDLEIYENKINGDFVLHETSYLKIYCLNQNKIPNINPTQFSFNNIKDFSPSIMVSTPENDIDIDESYSIPINLNIYDKYGINNAWVEYQIIVPEIDSHSPKINKLYLLDEIQLNTKEINVSYNWDINNLGLLMGDELHFWFLASDNNPNSTPTKTEKYIARIPSLEDLFMEIESYEQESDNILEDIKESIDDISDITEEVELDLLKNDDLSIEDGKKIEESISKVEEIKDEIEKIQESIENILEQAEKNNLFDNDLMQKFDYFQEMLSNMMTPELIDAMNELQKAMDNLDSQKIAEALENFEINMEEFENQLDRFIEMFEMAKAEQKLNELSEMIQNMIDKQKDLIDNLNSSPEELSLLNSKSLKQEQRFDNFTQLIEESINDVQKSSKSCSEDLKSLKENSLINNTKKQLNQGTENISNNHIDEAKSNSKNNKNNMDEISELVDQIKEDFTNESIQKISDEFISIINDLIIISNQQEEIMIESSGLKSSSPHLQIINSKQNNINIELNNLMIQLVELSNKTFYIKPEINKAFGRARLSIIKSISNFEQKKINPAINFQKNTLTDINLATFLLIDALNEMQNSNSPSGFQQFMEALGDLSQQQQGLNQKTMQLNQLGLMSQQGLLNELQSRQEKLKEQLGDLLSDNPGQQNGGMNKVSEDMEEVIQDFKNKNITKKTIERQQKILSRMLDNQKSLIQKDYSNKRTSKIGEEIIYNGPDGLPIKLGDKNLLLMNAMEAAMKEGYSNEYNKLIRNYFMNLQKENE